MKTITITISWSYWNFPFLFRLFQHTSCSW